jgi:hypothetical protein
MPHGFHRPSLSISIDADYSAFQSGDQHIKRVYWHEKFHFYQVWSQAYFARLALLEAQRLIDFETSESTACRPKLKKALTHLFAIDPVYGFSPWNLSEALTRFWDIMVSGFDAVISGQCKTKPLPQYLRTIRRRRPKDYPETGLIDAEFDYLMLNEDWYAKPYRHMLSGMRFGGSSSRLCAILFPLVAHFSFQSFSPVRVFVSAIDRLFEDPELIMLLNSTSTDQEWVMTFGPWNSLILQRWWYVVAPRVRAICDEEARRANDKAGIMAGWRFIADSDLRQNPIYGFLFKLLAPYIELPDEKFVARGMPDFPPTTLDTAFALPGTAVGNLLLKDLLQPPLIIFNDLHWIVWAQFGTSDHLKVAGRIIAEASLDRWEVQQRLDRAVALADLMSALPGRSMEHPSGDLRL